MMEERFNKKRLGRLIVYIVLMFCFGITFTGCVPNALSDNSSANSSATSVENSKSSNEASTGESKESGIAKVQDNSNMDHIRVDTPLLKLVNHPAFEGEGRLLLPWYGVREDMSAPFDRVSGYMPYHSAFDTSTMLAAVNALIDEQAEGMRVFYPVYTEDEIKADSSKQDVGLFFFRGKQRAPFAIVSPGGGFSYVGSLHESLPHAYELSKQGYNAFSLSYRAGSGELATRDLAAAVRFVFDHADELGVSVEGYSLWGSSAGARMASAVGTYGTGSFGMGVFPRPSAIVMAYTGQSGYTEVDPPTFSVVGDCDGIAPSAVMTQRIQSLKSAGVPAEIEVFPGVGHGFGLGIGTSAEGWINDAVSFWETEGCI